MPNLKHLTHGISNLVSLITKTKLGLSAATSARDIGQADVEETRNMVETLRDAGKKEELPELWT
jgi:hypothetical protein